MCNSVILKTFNIERAFLAIWPLVHGDNRSCNPRSVANNERLFFSAELDDTIIKTWSTLIISQKLMAQKAAELHDPADHFVVFVELKEHPLWWRSLSQKRTFMEPKIILTQNACSIDLLRAITIVCFCKSEYEKLDTVGGNDLDQISADILEKAYRSFRRDNGSIINNLRDNGWDINKFICSGLE